MNPPLGIPEEIVKRIFEQTEREYPRECCGMIFADRARPDVDLRVRPCRNAQDDYHARDPENFPRTSKTAYFIDPKELLAIQKEIRETASEIRVIYHSHIDTGAYFSEEDNRAAAPGGEPAYPGVDYFVVSVMAGKVSGAEFFSWDPEKKDFIPKKAL